MNVRNSRIFLLTFCCTLAQIKSQKSPDSNGLSEPYKAKPTLSDDDRDINISRPNPWCDQSSEEQSKVKFCEEDVNYPEKLVQHFLHQLTESEKVVLLSNTKNFVSDEEYFDDVHKQSWSTHKAGQFSAEGIISSDSMAAHSEEPVCVSVKTKFYPVKGINSENEWRFIVGGRSEETRQMIVMETCLGQVVDRPCDVETNTHQTVCRQKYANHRLLAVGPNGPYIDNFPVPSACTCHKTSNSALFRNK